MSADFMNGEQILLHIMRVKQCSREIAERELLEAIRAGKLPGLQATPSGAAFIAERLRTTRN